MRKSINIVFIISIAALSFSAPSVLYSYTERIDQDWEFGLKYSDFIELSPLHSCANEKGSNSEPDFKLGPFKTNTKVIFLQAGLDEIFGAGSPNRTITSYICEEDGTQILEFCATTGDLVVYSTISRIPEGKVQPNYIEFLQDYSEDYIGSLPHEETYKFESWSSMGGQGLIYSGYSKKHNLRRVAYYSPWMGRGQVAQVIAKLENSSPNQAAVFDEICPDDGTEIKKIKPKYGGLRAIIFDAAEILGGYERTEEVLETCKSFYPEDDFYAKAQKINRSQTKASYEKVQSKMAEILFNLERPSISERFYKWYNFYRDWNSELDKDKSGLSGAKFQCDLTGDKVFKRKGWNSPEKINKVLSITRID